MIDPDLQAFVRESESFYPAGSASLMIAEQRALYDAYAARFAVSRSPSVLSEDACLSHEGRCIPLRHYRTGQGPGRGAILYAHGGGFMLGSLDSHDGIVARVAERTGADVIAIDYRLAPDHPAPAALEDVRAVADAALVGLLPWSSVPASPLAFMGDSAGATLVAAAALAIGHDHPGVVGALALVYPALGFEPAEPARSEEAHAPMLTLDDVRFYRSVYLGGNSAPPLTFILDERDLSPLPPTVLLPAEHDPLRDDCTRLADRLRTEGGEVLLLPGTGLVHGCLRALDRSTAVASAFDQMLAWLRRRIEDRHA